MTNLKSLLAQFSPKELHVLQKIVLCNKADMDEIINSYSKLSLPVGGLFQKKRSYKQLLQGIGIKRGKDVNMFLSESEIELDLFLQLFSDEISNLSDTEKTELIQQLEAQGLTQAQITSITSLAAISAAQVSGFAIYVLASSTVGTISGILGISLPFAFYTTMSSAISVVIGPLGFLVLGYGLYRSFRHVKSLEEAKIMLVNTGKEIKNYALGNHERTEIAFKYIASIRVLKINAKKEIVDDKLKEIKSIEIEKASLQQSLVSLNEDLNKAKSEVEEFSLLLESKKKELTSIENAGENINKKLRKINLDISEKQVSIERNAKEIDLLKN